MNASIIFNKVLRWRVASVLVTRSSSLRCEQLSMRIGGDRYVPKSLTPNSRNQQILGAISHVSDG